MTSFLTNASAFIVLISILVAVHEYGHYIVGRWMGMKVLRYSIGFGKPLWTYIGKKDETEYCISSIPLGGYVRFLDSREGIVEPEDDGRAFDQRPIPARIAVLLAGPMFNFILAILLFWVLLPGDFQILKPAVGAVTPNSFADRAGMQYGDKIISVGDVAATEWEPTLYAILSEMADDGRVPLTLEAADGQQRTTVLDVGDAKTRLTEPGVLFDGLGFQRWRLPAIVRDTTPDGAARSVGILPGDEIVAIDGQVVTGFGDMADKIEPLSGKKVVIELHRAGELLSFEVTIGGEADDGKLGVYPELPPEDHYFRRSYSFFGAFNAALAKTWDSSVFTVTMLGRMVTGDVSLKNISGPINIAQIAGESVERGWRYAVYILAVISISLGVLNLLPVPVLDGGQIVYQIAEGIKGSPLSERAQILGQQAGIVALLLLMSFAFYNDIVRNVQ